MVASFPCDFCTDGGRTVINAGEPPINKPTKEEEARQAEQPDWLLTMPAGIRRAHEYWKQYLKQGGFGFTARVISYLAVSRVTSVYSSPGRRAPPKRRFG